MDGVEDGGILGQAEEETLRIPQSTQENRGEGLLFAGVVIGEGSPGVAGTMGHIVDDEAVDASFHRQFQSSLGQSLSRGFLLDLSQSAFVHGVEYRA